MSKDHSGVLRGRKPHISGLLPALVHAIKKYFCSDISIWQPKSYDQISFRHTSGQRHSGCKANKKDGCVTRYRKEGVLMHSKISVMDWRDMDLYEDYKSPFDFDTGVNKNYLYLLPSMTFSPPESPVLKNSGLLKNEAIPEGEDVVAAINIEALSEEEQEELRRELAKVEEEIQTLSQVLAAKEKHLAELKRKLGITSLQELKQNISKGWQDVTSTNAYKKTSETLSQAGQKASAAFSTVGSAITKKLEDVKNSPTFKSFEEKVENLKSKVGGNKPAGADFGDVLNSAANASATEATPKQTEEETQ